MRAFYAPIAIAARERKTETEVSYYRAKAEQSLMRSSRIFCKTCWVTFFRSELQTHRLTQNRFQGQTRFAMNWIENLFPNSSVNENCCHFELRMREMKTFSTAEATILVPTDKACWITPAQLIHKLNALPFYAAKWNFYEHFSRSLLHDLWCLRS